MSNLNTISNCRNRRTITTRDGRRMSVSCGKCVDCLYQQSQRGKYYCDCASRSHKYSVFFTLTYSDTYVPIMKLVQVSFSDGSPLVIGIDVTKRPLKTKGQFGDYTKRFQHYGTIVHTFKGSLDDSEFIKFYKKSEAIPHRTHPRYHTFKPLPRYHLRYSLFADAQNFIKRLRTLVSAEIGCDISFYITSEYGPETYRPHFHGELFFDDDEFAKHYQRFISKAWKFGNCPAEFTRDSGASSNYVGGYINSLSTLPRFLQGDFIAPKSSHSQYMASPLSPSIRDHIYQDVSRAFGKTVVPTPFGAFNWSPTSTNIRTLFPRCYDYDGKTPLQLFELYTIYSKLTQLYKNYKCSELAWRVLTDPYGRSLDFLRLLNICEPKVIEVSSNARLRPIPLKSSIYRNFHTRPFLTTFKLTHFVPSYRPYYRFTVTELYPKYLTYLGSSHYSLFREYPAYFTDDDFTVYDRVYSAILLSRNFLRFNCAKLPPADVLDLIRQYYDSRPLRLLKFQYEQMQEYFDTTRSTDYNIFYTLSSDPSYDYTKIYKSSSFIKNLNSYKDSLLIKKMKVRSLNDSHHINL